MTRNQRKKRARQLAKLKSLGFDFSDKRYQRDTTFRCKMPDEPGRCTQFDAGAAKWQELINKGK